MRPPPDSTPSDPSASVAAQLRRLLFHHRVPTLECEDCVQEAWLALLTAYPDWAPDGPRARAWLRGVAVHKAQDFHRRLQRHPSRRLQDLPSQPTYDPWPQTDREIDQDGPNQEAASRISDLLDELGEAERVILTLRASGLTYNAIGAELGLQPARIKARYRRIVRELRNKFTTEQTDALMNAGGRIDTRLTDFFADFFESITLNPVLNCAATRDASGNLQKLSKL